MAILNKTHQFSIVCAALFTLVSISANAALLGRLPLTPGGTDYQAAYDTVLDITWTTNASLSEREPWENRVDWASDLDYLGFNDWRLASMSVSAGLPTGIEPSVVNCSVASELACRDNELGYMFHHNFGGTLSDNFGLTETIGDVTFTGIWGVYWSGTKSEEFGNSWIFYFHGGAQHDVVTWSDRRGWAVRAGDVDTIPVPSAIWLFGSGLIGLVGVARRKKA